MTQRPIRFRAWDGKDMQCSIQIQWDAQGDIKWVEPDLHEAPLMQFTGLHDSYGVEIFESDILLGPVASDFAYTFKVPSLQYFHWFQELEEAIEGGKTIKVIGNTYANPEIHCDY